MIIYRAMCKEEYINTLKYKEPHFIRRFKWFSSDINFIIDRVQNTNFNNSIYIPNRYEYLVEFEANVESAKEIKIDRRDNMKIKYIKTINQKEV